jgi:hypothetical protein
LQAAQFVIQMSGAIHSPSSVHPRALQIRRILDARFSLSGLEEWKKKDPAWWSSASNDMGRGIYEQAMREAQRLESVSDGALDAELAAILSKGVHDANQVR